MRWWPLVLALIAGRAAAGPCGDDAAFPENGATGVPLKTFVWIRSDLPQPYVLRSTDSAVLLPDSPPQEAALALLAPGMLDPDTVYHLTANGVVVSTFTTGREPDAAVPGPPVVGHLHLSGGVVDMSVWSPGAAMLHVSIHRDQPGSEQLAEVWIPRSGLTNVDLAACTGVAVQPGDSLCFWVSSVGYSDRESGVTARCAVDELPPESKGPMTNDVQVVPDDSWLAGGVLLVLATVLALVYVAGRAGLERLYCKVCEPQPIDMVAVAWIARRQLLRRMIALGAVAAAAYFVLPAAGLGVVVAADLRRLVAVATCSAAILDPRRGRAYVTKDGRFGGWISVRPRDLARVAAAYIPMARVRRR